MKATIKRITLLSFCFMLYGGLRDFEYLADLSMIILVLAIIAYPMNNNT